MTWRPWQQAWHDALYGPGGFFLREDPGAHFRTSAAVPLFAEAVRRLAGLVDDALGRPDPFDVVDLGAGRGELLHAMPDVPARWRLTAVDLAPAPAGSALRWVRAVPALTGLLLANEWLDALPVPVLEDGREVLVDGLGEERLGRAAPGPWLDWARTWWPSGGRVEVGLPRDRAWAAATAQVARGLAVAVDYGHDQTCRRPTLTGYRDGRQVRPVPDGSCDLTAHVALDSCAAGGHSRRLSQREALAALGVSAALPDPAAPSYPALLASASQARELLDPAGLGGFGWLVREVGLPTGWMSW